MTSALRSVSGFDGAGALTPVLVLAAWCAAGLVLLGAGTVATRREPVADGDPDPITVPLARADADASIAAVRHGEPVGAKD